MIKVWLIWSNEHGAYWRAGRAGYTKDVAEAGRYSTKAAQAICREAGQHVGEELPAIPNEILVPSPELISTVVLMEMLG